MAGRPTVYRPENAEIARLACMLGATIPEFSVAVQQGREVADETVVSALFARATGMQQKMTKVFCHRGQPVTADYIAYLPPDVRACIFWLRNRRPEEWRENRLLPREEDDEYWARALEAGAESARLAAMAARAGAPATPNAAEETVRSAAERLQVHSAQS